MSLSQTYPRLLSRRSFIAGAIAATGIGAGITLPAQNTDKYYPGSMVSTIDLSGFSRSQANALLRAAYAPLENHAITYRHGETTWDASLADLGKAIDYDAMLDAAWSQGRDGSVVDRYATLLGQGDPRSIPLTLTSNDAVFDRFLSLISETTDEPMRNARLVRQSGEIAIIDDIVGARLNRDQARSDTETSLRTAQLGTVEVVTDPVLPEVTTAALADAKDDAVVLVSEPVVITRGDDSWEVTIDDLTAALRIPPSGEAMLDPARLEARLQAVVDALRVEPKNAVLGWDGGLYVIEDDVDGEAADLAELSELVIATAATNERTIDAPMTTIRAEARTDNIDDLGIAGLIARGSSSFAGSSEARAENVRVAAGHASYHLIAPGALFAFNAAIGPISLDTGYVEGKVIRGDWTASDLGGGVCQVSTTVFRAALYAGFRFDEWYPHSWRLAFYETDGSPPGQDAAIYQPNNENEWEKDLAFTNTLESWMLLQMVVDGDTVEAQLFAQELPYTVEIDAPQIGEPGEPGKPFDKENPDLRPGERTKVQNASPGYKVTMTRRLLDANGGVISEGQFVSDYKPQPEIWEVAPGEIRNEPEETPDAEGAVRRTAPAAG